MAISQNVSHCPAAPICVRNASSVPQKMPLTITALMAMPATSRLSTELQHPGPNIMARLAQSPLLTENTIQRRKRPESEPQITHQDGAR
mmetsp:Transcript_20663/g.37229  ORF Transcript_20663/g.37229 Transcript_20663/m.37229 type:complete len:89 (+) Transcript_20663:119-385(+)